MLRGALFGVLTLIAAPAFAQGAYVGGAVGLDISRVNHVEATGADDLNAGGEVLAFSARAGTPVGQNWGVELGFTRPFEVESESEPIFPVGALLPPATVGANIGFPIFETRTRFARRDTTVDTMAWVAKSVGSRVDLVYLGGLAFTRRVEEISFEFVRPLAGTVAPTPILSISYGVAPEVGFDARIGLTDHLRLVPSLRLQSAGGNASGWLIRTSAGLIWQF